MMKKTQLKPWLVLAVCCGLAAASMGIMCNSIGVFYTPVSDDLGVMKGSFTLHVTIASIVASFTALIIPKVLEKIDYKIILITVTVICSVSAFLMGMATKLWHFYVLGALRGIGINFMSLIPITMIIGNWFTKSTGLATSLVLCFSGIAGAVFSPLFTSIIANHGWRYAYFIMGICIIALSLPAILFPFKIDPAKEGKEPYGGVIKIADHHVKLEGANFNPKTIYFGIFVYVAVTITAITCFPQYFPSYALTLNLSASTGAVMLSGCMIGNILSKLIIGFLSDWIGSIKSTLVMLICNLLALIMLLLNPGQNLALAAAFIFGSIYSLGSVSIALLTKDFFGFANYSQAYSKVSFFTGFAGAFAASLIGYIYDFTSTYKAAIVLFIIMHVFIYIALLYLSKNKKRKKA